jgi:hypothetical protein
MTAPNEIRALPETPAEVAQAILNLINEFPERFDMCSWADTPDGEAIAPGSLGEERDCGTTLCAAGWAAYVTGWTLTADPTGSTGMMYARKGDVVLTVDEVAARALGLSKDNVFWYVSETTALERLTEIAEA